MLKKYYLQFIAAIIIIASAAVAVHALVDYGSHKSVPGHTRPAAGSTLQRPSDSFNNRGMNPPGGSGQPDRSQPPAPASNPSHGDRPHGKGAGPSGPWHQDNNSTSGPVYLFLLIYAGVFLLWSGLLYYLPAKGRFGLNSRKAGFAVLAVLITGFFLRLYLATLIEGHSGDLGFFRNWSAAAAADLSNFYSNSRCDYPPLYIYVLWLVGKANSLAVLQPYSTILLKLPSILADLATAGLIYQWSRRHLAAGIGLALAAFYSLNPAVFINSTLWGQVDSFFTLIVVLAVLALTQGRIGPASALFSAAVLMKPQGIIFLPVLAFELIRQRSLKTILKAAVWGLTTLLVIILPFAWQQGASWILHLLTGTIGEYPYASVNAFNLFSLLGANYVPDSQVPFLLSWHQWGLLFIVLTTAGCWWAYARENSAKMAPAAALLLIAGVFILGPCMHERYLFPAVALAILAFVTLGDQRFLALAAGFSITVFMNTASVLLGGLAWDPPLVAALNIALLVWLVFIMRNPAGKQKIISP